MYQRKGKSLTDTKNTLLYETNYKHLSVKNSLLEQLSSHGKSDRSAMTYSTCKYFPKKKKRKLDLTSTVWKDSHLLYQNLSALDVTNKFLIQDVPRSVQDVPRSVQDVPRSDEDLLDYCLESYGIGRAFGYAGHSLKHVSLASECPKFGFGGPAFHFGAPEKFEDPLLAPSAEHIPLRMKLLAPCSAPLIVKDECIKEMPKYSFLGVYIPDSDPVDFIPLEEDPELLFEKRQKAMETIKLSFLSIVSTSLFYSPNYKERDDECRLIVTKAAKQVLSIDPEFLLKVALYARRELNIRSTPNFLLAYAAYNTCCRPFLKKYFAATICLPSDWLEVAEIYLTFQDERIKAGGLPSMLRKVMIPRFGQFDEYQFGKYNKKAKKKKSNGSESDNSQPKPLTMKYLIGKLHICSPVKPVMCILGKKYPSDPEAFRRSGLSGTWDSEKAGKRMKLPIPETWETMVSTQGNKSHVWESLIENSKLPYMAMLRNLKNLIMSNIGKKYHQKVIGTIMNQNAVLKSKQFPLRFYAAYKTIEDIEKLEATKPSSDGNMLPAWKRKQKKAMFARIKAIDHSMLNNYKIALSKALEISVISNVDRIGGNTLVICDLVNPFQDGSNSEKVFQNCILLGLIFLKACEACEMKMICGADDVKEGKLENELLLDNMSRICSTCKPSAHVSDPEKVLLTSINNLLKVYLYPNALLNKKLDNIILLLSSSIQAEKMKKTMNRFLHKYRELANRDLLYVEVRAVSSEQSEANFEDIENLNNVYLSGCSDQVLRFIAEKGSGRQLNYVETIDQKYDLSVNKDAGFNVMPVSNQTASETPLLHDLAVKWKTVRIFVSSTFKDMHGERDLLLRYVFPELKARAAKLFVKIIDIELRWGINATRSESKKCAEICLREAEACDLFVGILGERYGTIFEFEPPEGPKFEWIKEHPSGSSITELEMEAGALRRNTRKLCSFFYFRNSDFIKDVSKNWVDCFQSENPEAQIRLLALKNKIRKYGVKLYDGYPCCWGGVVDEKPFVSGLEEFGQKVLSDLWEAVTTSHGKEKQMDELSYERQCQQSLIHSHRHFVGEKRTPLIWMTKEIRSKDGVFVVTGKPGCGKSAFLVRLMKNLGIQCVIPFFIGATPRSTQLPFMLRCISHLISERYPAVAMSKKVKQDIINQFHDVLLYGAKASGGTLILFLDGLDQLDENAQALDWLPCNIPSGVRIICSTSASSLSCKMLSKRSQHGFDVYFSELQDLDVTDRRAVVKHLLAVHSKALDESAFNNQMVQLISKVDCGIPLYIQLTCEQLKLFATFGNLMSTIQSFPSTLPQMMEYVFIQMEKQTNSNVVKKALLLLNTVKEGLEESELHLLLSLALSHSNVDESEVSIERLGISISEFSIEDLLAPIDFRELLHMIRIFILKHSRDAFMKISSPVVLDVLKKTYGNELTYYHRLLAAYYAAFLTDNRHSSIALRSLPFHLYHGRCYETLAETLCTRQFIQSTFQMNAYDDLLTHYVNLLDVETYKPRITSSPENGVNVAKVKDFYQFVLHNMHILSRGSEMVTQQAVNESVNSEVYKSVFSEYGLLKCITRLNQNDCRWFTVNVLKAATCVALHAIRPIAAIGNEDGYLKLCDLNTGKVIRCLKGHASSITSVCFIGNERMITSSSDNSICIWSAIDYVLLAILKGHTRYISGCVSDPTGRLILSSSWDCTVRFWNIQDGCEVSNLSEFGCPVNCIAHDPHLQLFACGLWNGNVEIWNSLSLKKKLVLRGHTGSVRFLAYSADGLNIISTSISSEVFIWSSEQGLKIGSLKGHTLPVNSIRFTLENNFFISASDDSSLKVWSNVQQLPVHIITESKFCPVHFMEIIKTNRLAVAFKNGDVWVIDLVDGHIMAKYENVPDQVSCFSRFCSLSHELASTSEDPLMLITCGTISGKIMTLTLGDTSDSIIYDLKSTITSIIHTNDLMFAGTSNGDIAVVSISDECRASDVANGSHEGSITALSIMMKGNEGFGLSASTDKTVKLWKITFTEELSIALMQDIGVCQKDYVTSCTLLPGADSHFDHVRFITGSVDNTVAFWDHDALPTVFEGLQATVVRVYSSKNYVFGCSHNGGAAMWTKSGSLVTKIEGLQEQTSASAYDFQQDILDPNDISIVVASVNRDGSIAISKPLQRALLCTFEGHSKPVTSCSVNALGDVISASPDKTVNIWKIPDDQSKVESYHEGKITGVFISKSGDVALSADINGNVILWAVDETCNESPLRYCTQKKYVGGFINLISPMDGRSCVCAVTFPSEREPKYMITVLAIDETLCDGSKTYFIKEQHSQYIREEICCIDYSESLNTFAIGLISGNVMLATADVEIFVKVSRDWILKLKITPDGANLCTTDSFGYVKQYSMQELIQSKGSNCKPKHCFLLAEGGTQQAVWTTAMYANESNHFVVGDSQGFSRLLKDKVLESQQIHTDSITGVYICVLDVVTSSLDKTVKVWSIMNCHQVAQFNSSTPITCMHACETDDGKIRYVLIGTTSGNVQLLKWWTY